MVSPKHLISVIESCLLGQSSPTAAQRIELVHALRQSLPSLKSLLSYPPPKLSDKAEVQSKEVKLPGSGQISLDDQDVEIALKLSEDLHLNEIDCVRLLVSANQEWGLLGRERVEIFRFAAGLWYTERRDLLTSMYTLLRAVVLDQALEADLLFDIQRFLEDLLASGLRQRLIYLTKELGREDPTGFGGPTAERYILDSRRSLVERKSVVSRERLILGHCLVLSNFIERASPKDIKGIFNVLQDTAREYSGSSDSLEHQVTFSLLFSIIIALISDALSTVSEKLPNLSHDASFRKEFWEIVLSSGNDPIVEGFCNCVRLAWVVHLMLQYDGNGEDIIESTVSNSIYSCLDVIFANNVFQFWLDKILHSVAYESDDEDMIYIYNAYLHKQMSCFLSHPLTRDKIRESKEKAMAVLSPYSIAVTRNQIDGSGLSHEILATERPSFVSLLEFVSEIYRRQPELLEGNDIVWTFVKFAGEDHTNIQTLVAFLKMLSTLACKPDGASKVFELLQGKTFRSIGWGTLFECLSIYDEKFKLSLQSPGAVLPEFQEGDAKALVGYLIVLQKVVENGSPVESKNWFPDIEPLFKLLSYENVPPYLKGALRNSIAAFVRKLPVLKDAIWKYLEQYDLPVVVGLSTGSVEPAVENPVYDMRFELNEVESRNESYPSTISFLNLLNTLITDEIDAGDRGQRFIGIFRFVYDHVFGQFPQRAYSDPSEKWELVIACLKHFHMMLNMYDVEEEDLDTAPDQWKSLVVGAGRPSQINTQLPLVELMKDFMSGKIAFRNIMGIILPGINFLISKRTNKIYGKLLEEAVLLSLEIIILSMEKDVSVSDSWRPFYQPLDVILSQDQNNIVALLELVRYDFQPQIQLCSIKILSILSSRIVGLAQLLIKNNAASGLIEDYAACLELRSEDAQIFEESSKDPGVLIVQLLIDNISRPAPNITHLLLKFDVDSPVERTLLQPKFHYSCLKVILDLLDKLSNPDINALLHEFSFQLLYELCVDPLTSAPIMDILCSKNYKFFAKHLSSIGVAPLPDRNRSQIVRISSLHQRAWMLKLLAIELHATDSINSTHRETCRSILVELFGEKLSEYEINHDASLYITNNDNEIVASCSSGRSKVLEMLEIIHFESPDISLKFSQYVSDVKFSQLAEDILTNTTTSARGVYYHSERGDQLIDLSSFRDKLWQNCNIIYKQTSTFASENELNEISEAILQMLRWAWKYNKNLEEHSAQLHMLTSWSQIVEISASLKMSFLENQSEILFCLLDAALNASGSPYCSLKMAQILTQVGLTCMAKLRDERFVFPGGLNSDTITCLDVIVAKRLSNGTCHSIFFKLILAILRQESSEALRRRQYALLLSYLQYCRHMLDPDVPNTILQFLSEDEQDFGDLDLEKLDKDQAGLAHANFAIVKKEADPFLNLVIKDASQGSEATKVVSLYVLDALICLDHGTFFLGQLQSRGFLRAHLTNISNFSNQDGPFSFDSIQRICYLEAELSLFLRISHKYGKSGAEILFSMGSLEHIASCRALSLQMKGNIQHASKRLGINFSADVEIERKVVTPVLRLVFSLTSLVDTSEFFEVKNKVVRQILDFVKSHQFLFDQIIREDLSDANELILEQINLVVAILSKVWPYKENDEYGFLQGLFRMMYSLFSSDPNIFASVQSSQAEFKQKTELSKSRLCFSLSSYLFFLVTKESIRLQISEHPATNRTAPRSQPPTLSLIVFLLGTLATALERASEEKYLLLNKLKEINELARIEVDEIISTYVPQDGVSSSKNIQRRRYIAMVGMCQIVGHRNRLIMLLLLISQNMMNILHAHFQERTPLDAKEDLHTLCGKLISVLERFEGLREDKTGQSLAVFGRLAQSLKDTTLRKLTL